MADADKKPELPKLSSTHINVKVIGQDGIEVFFRIHRCAQLRKLMEAYCKERSKDINVIRFLLDERRLKWCHTPLQVEMEDGDEISAMLEQDGGVGVDADGDD